MFTWKSKLSRLCLVSFKSPAENETKPELSLKTKNRRECWKILADFLVRSKIAASLGDKCLSVLCVEKSAKEVTRENGYQGKFFIFFKITGKVENISRELGRGLRRTFPLQAEKAELESQKWSETNLWLS